MVDNASAAIVALGLAEDETQAEAGEGWYQQLQSIYLPAPSEG